MHYYIVWIQGAYYGENMDHRLRGPYHDITPTCLTHATCNKLDRCTHDMYLEHFFRPNRVPLVLTFVKCKLKTHDFKVTAGIFAHDFSRLVKFQLCYCNRFLWESCSLARANVESHVCCRFLFLSVCACGSDDSSVTAFLFSLALYSAPPS